VASIEQVQQSQGQEGGLAPAIQTSLFELAMGGRYS
jgi:hypothetical protein